MDLVLTFNGWQLDELPRDEDIGCSDGYESGEEKW